MQTIDFISTAKWIVGQYSDATKDGFLRGSARVRLRDLDDRKQGVADLLRAVADVAVIAERLNAHPLAPAVLRTFGLEPLLEREFAIQIAEEFVAQYPSERPDRPPPEIDPTWRRLWNSWWIFENCIAPVENLTIPPIVASETDFDDVFTLELRYDGDTSPKAETVATVLLGADRLYAATCRGLGLKEFPQLIVVYADSGSAVRFDLRGLGEPIREAKGFLVELWNRFRHRRADDYRTSADAMMSGLRVVATIDALRSKGAINDEDAARYKRDVLEAGIDMFESGAMPREVPRVEIVTNQKILAEFQRKLLPAPQEVAEQVTPVEKASRPRSVSRRKRSKAKRKQ